MNTSIPVHEGSVPFGGYRTWYRMVGDFAPDATTKLPLIAVHGGPGFTHNYLEPLEQLAHTGRPVVLYDQLGCGHSDHPTDPTLWRVNLFVEELAALRQVLALNHVHLWGHSWGGMLILEYMLTQPRGVMSLILASTIATNRTFARDRERAYAGLPAHVQQVLHKHEADATTTDPEYQAARKIFDQQHVLRIDPPACFSRGAELRNPQIGRIMWEEGVVHGGVGLKQWDVTDLLTQIRVPTLITAGSYDGISLGQDTILQANIPGAERIIFEDSAHFPHLEEEARYLVALDDFLSRVEGEYRG